MKGSGIGADQVQPIPASGLFEQIMNMVFDRTVRNKEELCNLYPDAEINPLGDWTGGTAVDTGATNLLTARDLRFNPVKMYFEYCMWETKNRQFGYDIKVAPVDKNNKVGTYSKVSHRYMAAVTPVVKANKNGSITITAKRTSPVKGYKIYWSTNKNMTGALSRRVTTTGNLKNTIKASLKKGKTYYIRVIPVYVHNGNTYNGIYNTTKSVKVK